LTDLKQKLEEPTIISVNSGSKTQRKKAAKGSLSLKADTDSQTRGKKTARSKATTSQVDPVKKVLSVNKRAFKFSKTMNDTLLKIIERYELDKPIMMSDKLDIIWDKSEPIQE